MIISFHASAPAVSQVAEPFQSSSALLDLGYVYEPDSSSVLGNPIPGATLPSWNFNSTPPVSVPQVTKGIVCPTASLPTLFFPY